MAVFRRTAYENPRRFGCCLFGTSHHRSPVPNPSSPLELLFWTSQRLVFRSRFDRVERSSTDRTSSRNCMPSSHCHRADCCVDGIHQAFAFGLAGDVCNRMALGASDFCASFPRSGATREVVTSGIRGVLQRGVWSRILSEHVGDVSSLFDNAYRACAPDQKLCDEAGSRARRARLAVGVCTVLRVQAFQLNWRKISITLTSVSAKPFISPRQAYDALLIRVRIQTTSLFRRGQDPRRGGIVGLEEIQKLRRGLDPADWIRRMRPIRFRILTGPDQAVAARDHSIRPVVRTP